MPMFPKLFELGRMGSLVLPNRIVLAAARGRLS
jgi:2,4-dienoyl-CoA reductase-like NADH-dependent reductase (Old Yellow Enzyme family)